MWEVRRKDLAERVAREKLELGLKATVHAANSMRKLALQIPDPPSFVMASQLTANQPLPSPAVKPNFNPKIEQVNARQRHLEAFIAKCNSLIAQVENTQRMQQKAQLLEVLRLMLGPSSRAAHTGVQFGKLPEGQNEDLCVLIISDDEDED
ncbi:hypothetical protein B0H14DRAFT_2652492 [Mycena olivaceomarginata]|nr:hypothetical protein B0H14DRAFT_2652492 [Mycena olivaceomarginata]